MIPTRGSTPSEGIGGQCRFFDLDNDDKVKEVTLWMRRLLSKRTL